MIWRLWKIEPKRDNPDLSVVTTIQNTLTKDAKMDDSMNYALKVNNVYKSYSSKNYAVNNVSFKVNLSECYGLLGKKKSFFWDFNLYTHGYSVNAIMSRVLRFDFF